MNITSLSFLFFFTRSPSISWDRSLRIHWFVLSQLTLSNVRIHFLLKNCSSGSKTMRGSRDEIPVRVALSSPSQGFHTFSSSDFVLLERRISLSVSQSHRPGDVAMTKDLMVWKMLPRWKKDSSNARPPFFLTFFFFFAINFGNEKRS